MDWEENLVITKDPDSDLDYVFNWSDWLGADTIASCTVTAAAGLTAHDKSNTTTAVTIWLSGGTAGTSYTVTCEIVTANAIPRTVQRSVTIYVAER